MPKKLPKGWRVTVATAKVDGKPIPSFYNATVTRPNGSRTQLAARNTRGAARHMGRLFAFENAETEAKEKAPFKLTKEEKEVAALLGLAFSKYSKLDGKNPTEELEFVNAIHTCQYLIAKRVALRVDPDFWEQF